MNGIARQRERCSAGRILCPKCPMSSVETVSVSHARLLVLISSPHGLDFLPDLWATAEGEKSPFQPRSVESDLTPAVKKSHSRPALFPCRISAPAPAQTARSLIAPATREPPEFEESPSAVQLFLEASFFSLCQTPMPSQGHSSLL